MHQSINLSLEVIPNYRRQEDKRTIAVKKGDTIEFTSLAGDPDITFDPPNAVTAAPVTADSKPGSKRYTVQTTPFTYSPSLKLKDGRKVDGLPHVASLVEPPVGGG